MSNTDQTKECRPIKEGDKVVFREDCPVGGVTIPKGTIGICQALNPGFCSKGMVTLATDPDGNFCPAVNVYIKKADNEDMAPAMADKIWETWPIFAIPLKYLQLAPKK